ncbi:MAG: biotin/lipoyl-binding protein [Lachnospiraceae bacterium]|nr:biotin/lipoyl-binding protein [Lachnospiraceae bacterium]
MRKLYRICAVLLVVVMLTGCGEKKSVPELKTPVENPDAIFTAKKMHLNTVTVKEGSVCPDVTDIKFDFDSSAYDVKVKTGDYVKAGDVLFYLDKDLEVKVKEAEVELTLRKKNYEVAVKQHADQIKNLKNLRTMFGNMSDWYNYKYFDIAIRESDAKFDIQYADAYQEILEFEDEYLELKEQYENSEIKAPIDGRIVYLGVKDDGDPIREEISVVSIASMDRKLLCCELIEEKDYKAYTDVKAVIRGKEYDVTYIPYDEEELYNKQYRAKKLYSYFTVEGLPEDVDYGEYVTFYLTAKTPDEYLCVPSQAIIRSNGENFVRVISGDRQGMRAVTTGISDKNYVEVTYGLSEGETIFVANNLARYGVTYNTTNVVTEDYELSGSMPVTRRSFDSEPLINPVPGKIKEIFVPTYSQVYVTAGQKLYTVTPEFSESDRQEVTQGLKIAKETYDKKIKQDKEALDKQLKKLREMKAGVEKELAQLKYNIALAEYEDYVKEGQELIDKYQELMNSYEEWTKGDYTVYAEKEGYLSSFAKYTVGKEVEFEQVMCDFYSPDCLYYEGTDAQYRFRYGMTVDMEYTVNEETFHVTGKVISAYDVRPEESRDFTSVYVMLDAEDFKNAAASASVSATYCLAQNVTTIPTELISRDRNIIGASEDDEDGTEEEDPLMALLNKNTSEEEAEKGVPFVWVYDENGQAVKRYITIVEQSRERTWICDGLTTDDKLVIH